MKLVLSCFIGLIIGAAASAYYFNTPSSKAVSDPLSSGAGIPVSESASASTPAYLVVLGDVHDREAFMSGYAGKLSPLYEKYGGEYLAVGRNKQILENGSEFQSFVVSKWPSMEAARAFWSDPEYEALKVERIDKNWSKFDVYLLEGLPEKGN